MKDNWISVEDELPKPRKKYLTYNSNADKYDIDYQILEVDDNNHFVEWSDMCDRFVDVNNVTHWQPLPQPPKDNK